MASAFFGLNIARSGLFVSQRALHVVSHNIANANTPGYSRQRLDMKQYPPDVLPGLYGTLGTGVDAESVIQIREEFFDKKSRVETSKEHSWQIRQEVLDNIETIFNEPSETGIRQVVDNFFSALSELSKSPDSLTTRALVRQRAIAYTESVGAMYHQLKELQEQIDFQVRSTVNQINGFAEQIRDLNKSIFLTELDGSISNDLRDQRNLVLDKLSELTEITYHEDPNRHFTVFIGGKPLVSHYDMEKLKVVDRENLKNPDDLHKLCDVQWEKGSKVYLRSGELSQLINMRDDIKGDKKGIPYYIDKLNYYTDRMSSEINRIHQNGFDLNGNKGVLFFTKEGMSSAEYEEYLMEQGLNGGKPMDFTKQVMDGVSVDYSVEKNNKIMARNIRNILENNPDNFNKSIKRLSDGNFYMVDRIPTDQLKLSEDLDLDLNKFAASASADGVPGDGHNALRMMEMRYNKEQFAWGSSDDFVKSLISNLGVDAEEAKRMKDNQSNLLVEIENKRQSVMGVSFDEEVSEMIKFQHAYNANARMLTTMDEILDTLINRLGTVGR